MPPPQLVDHLRARIILQAPQVLQAERANRLDLLVITMRLEHDVGKDFQSGYKVAAECRSREAGVQRLSTLGMAHAQVIKRREQFATAPRSGTARDPLRHHRGRTTANIESIGYLVRRPGGDEQGERRGLHPRHGFTNEHQPVGIFMLFDRLGR